MTKQPTYKPSLHERVVAVQLSCSFSWGQVLDQAISDEVNYTKHSRSALKVRKTLMPEASGVRVDKLRSVLNDFYTWHKDNTLSTPTKGQRLLPVAFHFIYMEKFGDAKQRADDAFDDLVAHYADDVDEACKLLKDAFKAEDYPVASEIKRYYNMSVQLLPVPQGNALLNVLGKEVANDVDQYVETMAQVAIDNAKAKLKGAVSKMVDRLATPDAIFRDTLTSNMDDLLGVLPMMNVTDDPEFAQLIKDAKETLQGWAPDQLRKNPQIRSQVANAAMDILKRM